MLEIDRFTLGNGTFSTDSESGLVLGDSIFLRNEFWEQFRLTGQFSLFSVNG